MRILLVVLALGSLLLVTPQPTAAAASAQMTVRAGFDGIGKVGGWMPIEVEVRNDGPDIDGEVQIIVTDTSVSRGTYTRAPTVYTAPAVLPRRSHKRLLLEAEVRATGQRIQARLVEGSTIVSEQDVQLTRVASGDLLCGVLSRTGPAFDFLPSLDLPPPLRRARIAHLEVSDLPARPQLLASLDCLIFDNISTASMLQGQKDALATWVNAGGLLVVIGGPTWQRTVSAIPPDLLPVKVSGLTSLDDLSALGELGEQPISDPGPWLVSQATLTDGSAVVEQDGVPLIAAARRGIGTVMYLAVDPTSEPLRSWPGAPGLWRYVLAHGTGGVGLNSPVTSSFIGWGRFPRNALVDISTLGGPSPGWLIAALALYAVVVGPLNYLFVTRIGRPAWSLVTIPLITALAAVGTFTMAATAREGDVILNKISLIRGNRHAPAHGRTYVSVLSRQQAAYEITSSESALLSGLYFPFPRDPSAEGQNWSLRVVGGPSPMVSGLQLGAGSLGTLVADHQVRLDGQLESDLRLEGRQLVGTITNTLGVPLYDAALILDYQVTRIGDLRVGETREVSINLAGTASAGFGPPTSFSSLLYPAGSGRGARRPTDSARRDVLDSVFGSGFNFTRLEFNGPTLMGWLDKSGLDLEVRDVRPSVLESTLYISSLPIGLPKGYEGELPASTVSRRQLGATTLNRQQFGSYDLANGEAIALQFTLPVSNGRFLLDGVYVNIDGRFRGVASAGPALGEVSLYNWRSAEWEDRIVGFGRNLVKDAAPYVSAVGDVRVRYTFKPAPDSGATGVSFSRFDVTAAGLMR
jgi:hypothetical protein